MAVAKVRPTGQMRQNTGVSADRRRHKRAAEHHVAPVHLREPSLVGAIGGGKRRFAGFLLAAARTTGARGQAPAHVMGRLDARRLVGLAALLARQEPVKRRNGAHPAAEGLAHEQHCRGGHGQDDYGPRHEGPGAEERFQRAEGAYCRNGLVAHRAQGARADPGYQADDEKGEHDARDVSAHAAHLRAAALLRLRGNLGALFGGCRLSHATPPH